MRKVSPWHLPLLLLVSLSLGLLLGSLQPSGSGGAAQAQEEGHDRPILQVSPSSLGFRARVGTTPAPLYLSIANAGGELMEWHASADAGWIILGAEGGKLSGGREIQLLVWVRVEGLEPGKYRGRVTISAEGAQGSPVQVPVLLWILSEQAILNEDILALIGADYYFNRGITGQGVRVGVIDLGFAGIDELIQQGELPEGIVAWNCLGRQTAEELLGCRQVSPEELSEASAEGIKHGTAVAEIIHDVAPEAELYLFLIRNGVELDQAVAKAIDEGIQVINHSVAWFNDGSFYDGHGITGQIVRDAWQNGIFWVNAAGNFAKAHYQGVFQDRDGDHYHDEVITLEVPEEGILLTAYLTWDAWPKTFEDFDLFLIKGPKQAAASINRQNGTEPDERIFYLAAEAGTYTLKIKWVGEGPPPDREMELFVSPSWLELGPAIPESSLPAPANAPEAFVVGAVNPKTLEIEPFSSRGPTNTGLTKPDLVAPDCLRTATYEGAPSAEICGADGLFAGTAASAPLVAGAAALLLSEDPSRSAADLARILKERATPKGDPNTYGAGVLNLRQ